MPTVRMTKNGESIYVANSQVAQHERLGWSPESENQTGVVLRRTVVLSDEEIKALPTTPVEIVPAPEAGKFIVPILTILSIQGAYENPYTNMNAAGVLELQLADSAVTVQGLLLNNEDASWNTLDSFFASNGSVFGSVPYRQTFIQGYGNLPDVYDRVYQLVNQAVNLVFNNLSSGDLEDGDAANTLTVTVFYAVIDL